MKSGVFKEIERKVNRRKWVESESEDSGGEVDSGHDSGAGSQSGTGSPESGAASVQSASGENSESGTEKDEIPQPILILTPKSQTANEFSTISILVGVVGFNVQMPFMLWLSLIFTLMAFAYHKGRLVEKLQLILTTTFTIIGLFVFTYSKYLHLTQPVPLSTTNSDS